MSTGYFVTLVGDAVDKAVPGGKSMVKQTERNVMVKEAAYRLLPAIAVGVLGGVFWKKHRVLGVLGGLAAGGSIYPLAKGELGSAARTLIPTAAGIGVSLKWKKHPAWGYILPSFGMSAAITAIEAARKS